MTRARLILLSMVVLTLVPLVAAWLFVHNPQWIRDYTNYGQLIAPPFRLSGEHLTPLDSFSSENFGELEGRWVLFQVVLDHPCNKACVESLYKTRQVRLMLNKDLMRVRRLLLIGEQAERRLGADSWKADRYLLRARVSREALGDLLARLPEPVEEGMVLIRDPLGNVILWYPEGFDPYGLKRDLARLLKVSSIG